MTKFRHPWISYWTSHTEQIKKSSCRHLRGLNAPVKIPKSGTAWGSQAAKHNSSTWGSWPAHALTANNTRWCSHLKRWIHCLECLLNHRWQRLISAAHGWLSWVWTTCSDNLNTTVYINCIIHSDDIEIITRITYHVFKSFCSHGMV